MDHRLCFVSAALCLIGVLCAGCAQAPAESQISAAATAATEPTGSTEAAETQQTTTTTQTTTTQETTWTTTAAQTPRADYQFRKYSMLESHYYKHGIDMGFDSPEEYLAKTSGSSDRSSEQLSLQEALIAADIFSGGRAHNGMDDARNTALLFRKLLTEEEIRLNPYYEEAHRPGRGSTLQFSLGDLLKGLDLEPGLSA